MFIRTKVYGIRAFSYEKHAPNEIRYAVFSSSHAVDWHHDALRYTSRIARFQANIAKSSKDVEFDANYLNVVANPNLSVYFL